MWYSCAPPKHPALPVKSSQEWGKAPRRWWLCWTSCRVLWVRLMLHWCVTSKSFMTEWQREKTTLKKKKKSHFLLCYGSLKQIGTWLDGLMGEKLSFLSIIVKATFNIIKALQINTPCPPRSTELVASCCEDAFVQKALIFC